MFFTYRKKKRKKNGSNGRSSVDFEAAELVLMTNVQMLIATVTSSLQGRWVAIIYIIYLQSSENLVRTEFNFLILKKIEKWHEGHKWFKFKCMHICYIILWILSVKISKRICTFYPKRASYVLALFFDFIPILIIKIETLPCGLPQWIH